MMSENTNKKRKIVSQSHMMTIAAKSKQQSMSKFMLTGGNSNNKVNPTPIEYFKCPHCSAMFLLSKIIAHSETCVVTSIVTPLPNVLNENTTNKNVFEELISAEKSNRTICYCFTMKVIDNRLHPQFSMENEDDAMGVSEETWTATAKVNKFKSELFLPSNCVQHKSVLIKLRTNIPQLSAEQSSNSKSSPLEFLPSTSLLKSMIQKGIRRRQTRKVLKLSATLSVVSLQEMLRRLPVICLEDGLLHPGVTVVVWLMMAHSKGFQPPQWLVDFCLLVAAETSQCLYRDCHAANETGATKSAADARVGTDALYMPEASVSVGSIENSSVRTLVASLLLRAGFGGMGEDMLMLEDYADIWHRRLSIAAHDADTSDLIQNRKQCALSLSPPLQSPTGLLGACLSPAYLDGLDGGVWGRPLLQAYGHTSSGGFDDSSLSVGSAVADSIRTLVQAIDIIYSNVAESPATDSQSSRLISGSQDLVAEGIDFHCDWGLVPHVLEQCSSAAKEEGGGGVSLTENQVKQVLWRFRSSINAHQLWPAVQGQARRLYDEWRATDADEKQALSSLWRKICPVVNAYCARKLAILDRKVVANRPKI